MRIELACGRTVTVSALHFQETYLGLLLGAPDEALNQRIIANATKRADELWGPRKVHLIPPAIVDKGEGPRLPPVQVIAWLHCLEPVNPAFHASELVVVWFRGPCDDASMTAIVASAIRSLPWDDLAHDFLW